MDIMDSFKISIEELNITSNDIGKSFVEIFPDVFERDFINKMIDEDEIMCKLTDYGRELFYNLWHKIFEIKMDADMEHHFISKITEAISIVSDEDIYELDRYIISQILSRLESEIAADEGYYSSL